MKPFSASCHPDVPVMLGGTVTLGTKEHVYFWYIFKPCWMLDLKFSPNQRVPKLSRNIAFDAGNWGHIKHALLLFKPINQGRHGI